MAGLINWRKVAPPGSNPDTNHLYVGVDPSDCKLYIKDDTGLVTKYETTADVAAAISAALAAYDLSTVVDSKISVAVNNLINGASSALDTLNELATALGNDPNFATTITTALSNRLRVDTAAQGLNSTQKTNAKTNIDLQNLDNTSDLNKPISTATQTALNLKYDASNPSGYQNAAQVSSTANTAVSTHEGLADPHPQYASDTDLTSGLALKYDASNPSGYQTAAQVTSTVNAASTTDRARANHTGTQLKSTISDFAHTHPLSEIQQSSATSGQVPTWNGSAWIPTTPTSGVTDHTLLTNIGTNTHAQIDSHIASTSNPHSVTKAQVGLGNVDNTSDADKPVSTATQTALNGKANLSGGNTFTGNQIFNSGQIGVGATPVASAKVQIDSTTQGFLLPRMTSAQRLAIATPADCLMVHDTDLGAICVYTGTYWSFEYDVITTAIQASTSTTYANITELVTSSLEAGLYAVRFRGIMQSTLTTTGVGLRLTNNSGAISEICVNWQFSQAANGTDKNFEYSQIATGDNVTSTGVLTANANLPVAGDGVVRISTAGALVIQLRTEILASGVSIRPNSSLILKKVGA